MEDKATIGELGGEFAFISRALAQVAADDERLIVGPGDDAAVIRCEGECAAVVTTDLLVEGRHFRLDWIYAYDAGWRAAVSSLSDLAAMGARPRAGFFSLGVPPDTPSRVAEDMVRGVSACLRVYGAVLAGGDTVASTTGTIMNICLTGDWPGRSCLRSAAKPGDCICVTGRLGGARAALRLLERLGPQTAWNEHYALMLSHAAPYARVEAGQWLTGQESVHAMMDISDGLSSDLWRIAEASGVRCLIDAAKLPCSPGVIDAASLTGEPSWATALHGGEDFELVFTVDAAGADELLSNLALEAGTQGAVVGRVVEGAPGVYALEGDGAGEVIRPAFEHFG